MAYQPKSYRKFVATAATATLVASAVAPLASAATFTDVQGEELTKAVDFIVAQGIAKGYADGKTFGAADSVKRIDAAVMFARALKLDTASAPASAFTDVPKDRAGFVNALKAKGYVDGKEATKFGVDSKITRNEMSKILADAMGLKVDTAAKVAFTDVNEKFAPYVKAVVDAKLIDPKSATSFGAETEITRGEIAVAFYRALGGAEVNAISAASVVDSKTIEVTFDAALTSVDVKDFSIEGVELESATIKAAKAADAVKTVVVLKTKTELKLDTKYAIKYKGLTTDKLSVEYKITTATKVASVSATNLKEVVVSFDGTVDAATAENKENYTLSTGTVDSAELAADGKTVTLTLVGELTNQVVNKLTVKNVKAGTATVSVTDFGFTPLDNALPTVVEVTNLGTKAVKVVFSEPIEKAVVGNFKIDGKAFYGTTTQGSREVILTPYESATLSVGEHTLVVAGVEDYFGLKALSSEHKFTVVEDKTAPTVLSVEATLETAVVTFSEAVDPSTVLASNVYWKSGDTKKYANGTVKKLASDKYEFSFSTNPLPAYETILNVEGVKDYSGNAISATQAKVTAKVDQSRPEVTEVKADSSIATNITVKFSKVVDAADKKYFTVLDQDGKVQPVSNVIADATGKVFTVVLYNALAEGNNTIKVAGVKDKTALQNTMLDYQSSISVKDTTGPSVVGNPSVSNSTRSMIITFNEVMDLATLANASNYLIGWSTDGIAAATTRQLPAGTEITPVQGGKAVVLTFPEYLGTTKITFADASASPAIAGTLKSIQVMGVKDVAGNVLAGFTDTKNVSVSAATLAAYDAANAINEFAALTEKNTIKVKFDQAIGTATATDFVTSNPAVTVQSATADGSNVVTLKLAGAVETSTAGYTLSVKNGNALKTVNGNAVVPNGAIVTIKDQVKPEVKLAANQVNLVTTGNTIALPFSENLTTTNQGLMATDLVVTNLTTNTAVTLDRITTTVNNNVLNIAVTPVAGQSTEYSVKVKSGATYIKDLAGNKAVESATYETVRGAGDGIAPVIEKITRATVTTLEIDFNEAVNAATLDHTGFVVVDSAATAYAASNATLKVGTTDVVVLTIATTTAAAGDLKVTYTTTANKNEDLSGNDLGTIATPIVVDLTVPTATLPVATGTTNNANTFVVTFSEGLSIAGTPVAHGTDVKSSFTAAGGTLGITSAIYDATNKTVTFTVANAANTNTITHNSDATKLTDASGNAYAAKVYTYTSATTLWATN
ncbi:S-layer homology domain-containing protein [Bacillus sp. CGMCC 1.16607]|uniref:S-layer homology domain-containing protein n=1 Tax=Bacillus sp. CGMCC 1.16607 TaxID=3351842 RepID=UPI003628E63C